MGLTTAERNRRKRERKKREREERRKQQQQEEEEKQNQAESTVEDGENERRVTTTTDDDRLPNVVADDDDGGDVDVEIEYVAEPLIIATTTTEAVAGDDKGVGATLEALRRFQERSLVGIVRGDDDEHGGGGKKAKRGEEDGNADGFFRGDDDEDDDVQLSNRKLREIVRPSVAELKRRVDRPDLVEAHDVTASDPDFLIRLKAVPGTVPVPRHWGRKRKYLQGKRGFEKPPFQLPDFIAKTGIEEIRDTVAEEESSMSARQKNRARVAPKMGSIDVDYRTLHDAFFKHQTKPTNLTPAGDLYYEGKELEVRAAKIKPGGPLSAALRDALGMSTPDSSSTTTPPPWLINMQRYGPPPSYPSLKIPGLNAPLPDVTCQYGYHPGGWGKPPVDPYGRPLYGGNPFDPPGMSADGDDNYRGGAAGAGMVTSDGKTIGRAEWGSLPTGDLVEEEEEESEEEEASSDEGMEESDEEEEAEEGEMGEGDGIESVLPPPSNLISSTAPIDLRKDDAGDETPVVPTAPPKQLYQVIEQRKVAPNASSEQQPAGTTVFASEVTYVLPGAAAPTASAVPEGAESVLSKALPAGESAKRKRKSDEGDEDDLGKNFKF